MKYAYLVLAMAVGACAPTSDFGGGNVIVATEPQYAPDDPCKGVVPQLCPR